MYGTRFKNNVFYVSVNSTDPVHLHDFRQAQYRWLDAEGMHRNFREAHNYRQKADYAVWLNNLRNRKTDFLFIYSLHHTRKVDFPIEEAWAKEHPEEFIPVFNKDTVRIYKIIK